MGPLQHLQVAADCRLRVQHYYQRQRLGSNLQGISLISEHSFWLWLSIFHSGHYSEITLLPTSVKMAGNSTGTTLDTGRFEVYSCDDVEAGGSVDGYSFIACCAIEPSFILTRYRWWHVRFW